MFQIKTSLSFGQVTVVPNASAMISTSEFGLQTGASPALETSIQTLVALRPNGTKWTSFVGFVKQTLPSTTFSHVPLQSKMMHFFFPPLLVSVLLLTLTLVLYNKEAKQSFQFHSLQQSLLKMQQFIITSKREMVLKFTLGDACLETYS